CHNTGLKKNYTPETDSYATRFEELSVGCEACHGPAREHILWQQRYPNQKPDPTLRKIEPKRVVDMCGSCHARRLELTGNFLPGDLFLDHYLPEIPGDNDVYYPDGQVHEEDYEYVSFLLSRMYRENVVCVDCHEPHTAGLRAEGNALCLECHEGKIDPAGHSHHRLDQPGGWCVSCHMPVTVYMQRQPRHDHGFTIPDPQLTVLAGIPNACNRCHTDQSAEWAATAVGRWYGSPLKRRTGQRARVMTRVREDDPSAVPELAKLALDDPSAAWRAVAAGLLERWIHLPQARNAIVHLLKDVDPLVRAMAVSALEAARQEAVKLVRPLLEDPVRAVRIRSAWILRGTLPAESPVLQELKVQLLLGEDQPAGALLLGNFFQERDQIEKAIKVFRRALLWDRGAEPLWESLAIALSQAGRTAEAVATLREGCARFPASAHLRYLLGLARAEVTDWDGAIQALQEACSLEPGFARGWYNLGLALHRQKRETEAVDALGRAAALEPSSAEYPFALATVYRDLGRLEEAERAARAALQSDPRHRGARQLLLFLDSLRVEGGRP
ncbi:tetratricopeptide repeat protein, partial [Acidobacteria bacterium AH-259-G07]|nr:tetratricopeptide repeat protein [Acidobacteria bacterium AH-259-G07]